MNGTETCYCGLKATFDTDAALYSSVRPGYPDEIVAAVIEQSGLAAGSRILEIGCGTGNATAPFAERGYAMLCLEPGPNLAAAARARFRDRPNVSVEPLMFEEWPVLPGAFDLVLSAQAFHWVDPEVGFAKSTEALCPGGSLALLWNLAVSDPPSDPYELTELSDVIQGEYAAHAPALVHARLDNTLDFQVARLQERLRSLSDVFPEQCERRISWCERYDTDRYLALLATYSGHIALPEEQRAALFSGLRRAVAAHGGVVTKRYLSLLLFARKR